MRAELRNSLELSGLEVTVPAWARPEEVRRRRASAEEDNTFVVIRIDFFLVINEPRLN